MRVCQCVCAEIIECMRQRARVCVHVSAHVHVRAYVHTSMCEYVCHTSMYTNCMLMHACMVDVSVPDTLFDRILDALVV